MTTDIQDAVGILVQCRALVIKHDDPGDERRVRALWILYDAIRHLAYPDRDVYPKTRRGTKGAPIVRK